MFDSPKFVTALAAVAFALLAAASAHADILTTGDGVVHDPAWTQRIEINPDGSATFHILQGSYEDWSAEEFPVAHTWVKKLEFLDPETRREGRRVDLSLKSGQEFSMATLLSYADGTFQIAANGQAEAYPVAMSTIHYLYLEPPPEEDFGMYERTGLDAIDFNLESGTWAEMNAEFVQKNATVINNLAGQQVVPVAGQEEETFFQAFAGWAKERVVSIAVFVGVLVLLIVWRVMRIRAIEGAAASA